MTKQYNVFLSYSRTDGDMMRRVTDDLRKRGFSVWNDEALEPGTPSWKDAIEAALEGAETVVALLSPDAKKSEWIERELDYARAQSVPIIPVIVRGETQSAVPFELITVQRADLRKDYNNGLSDLQEALADQLKRPDLRPPARTRPIVPPSSQSIDKPDAPANTPNRFHVWNPVSYGRLLILYFFNPDRLQQYELTSRRAVAAWLASTLIWLPITINIVRLGSGDVPLWGINAPFSLLPVWVVPLGWLATGLIGQINFDEKVGLKALLSGPASVASVALGLGAALLYIGSLRFAQPPLVLRDGLAYISASTGQQVLIVAGGLSVFVGMILANTIAKGFAGWVSAWASVGFVGFFGLLFYLPIGAQFMSGLVSGEGSATTDVTASGIFTFASTACCMGLVLFFAVNGIIRGLMLRRVSGFNFFVLVMLVAAYGLLLWGHSMGSL